jgi:hypothetical protein
MFENGIAAKRRKNRKTRVRGMIVRGMGRSDGLIIPLTKSFSLLALKQEDCQKKGVRKISGSYVHDPIFLTPFL